MPPPHGTGEVARTWPRPLGATTGRRDWSAVPWDVPDEKAPDVAAQLRAERKREGWRQGRRASVGGQGGRQPGTMPRSMKGIGIALVLLGSLVALGLGLLVAQSEGMAQGAVTFGVGGVIAYVGFETFNRARDRERGEKLRTDEAARRVVETEAGGPGSTEGRSDS